MEETQRYQALDGIRGVAILLVLVSHARTAKGMPDYPQWYWHLADVGNLGVRIFFVLSGFIITHLLLREAHRTSNISLRAFYIRRAFRITPPIIGMMCVVGLGVWLGYFEVPRRQLLMILAFVGNYATVHNGWTIGHLWSLAVEEQFYLLWPAVLACTVRKPQLRYLFIMVSFLLAPTMRALNVLYGAGTPFGFFENSDALAMGAFAALVLVDSNFARLRRILETVPSLLSAAMIVVLQLDPVSDLARAAIRNPLIHLFLAALILRVIRSEPDLGMRILSSPPLVFIGTISYSLYLFQQPALNQPPAPGMIGVPWSILAAFIFAIASYYFIERQSAKWRSRILQQ